MHCHSDLPILLIDHPHKHCHHLTSIQIEHLNQCDQHTVHYPNLVMFKYPSFCSMNPSHKDTLIQLGTDQVLLILFSLFRYLYFITQLQFFFFLPVFFIIAVSVFLPQMAFLSIKFGQVLTQPLILVMCCLTY